MDLAAVLTLQVLYGIASLALISVGLAIVFGMMRVINLAHGEFLMLGVYTVVVSTNAGVNLWLAMLVLSPLVVGIVGVVVERLLIRHLYGRMVDTLLATWGLSLLLIGLVTTLFGATTRSSISPPFGPIKVGAYSTGGYEVFLIFMAVAILAGLYALLRFTRLGLLARGTMQDSHMAAALGVNPSTVYAVTFGIGAALSGLAGGLLAPLTGALPTIGAAFIAKAFIAVISGGASIVAGTASASVLLGTLNSIGSWLSTPVIGEVALLLGAVLLLRLLPSGITGRFFRGRL